MTRHWILDRKLFTIVVVLVVGLVIAAGVAGYSFYSASSRAAHDRTILCKAQNHSNLALRRILNLAQAASPPTEKSTKFYNEAKRLAKPINCDRLKS